MIALSGGELVYFEMDPSGQLNEYTERKEMNADVVCMSLGEVPRGEQRCKFLSVGLSDNTVRVICLDPSDCLSPLSMQVCGCLRLRSVLLLVIHIRILGVASCPRIACHC